MSENPLAITKLNDYIFCPASIYFHSLDEETEKMIYQGEAQINGTNAHKGSDSGTYSTKAKILQGMCVYSDEFNLFGKIDVFDSEKGILIERKKKIKAIYDGYVFQLYAQYLSLKEMGYKVDKMQLYSMDDNKTYPIELPENNSHMYAKFIKLLSDIAEFQLEGFKQKNSEKCKHCIYEPLCVCSTYSEEI